MLVVAIIVTIILLIFVIPQFESLFKGFGADLPAFTQLRHRHVEVRAEQGLATRHRRRAAASMLSSTSRNARAKMREFLDRVALQSPDHRPDPAQGGHRPLRRTLSTMFAAGVPLVEALDSVAGATGNIVYENAVMRMKDEVATGQRLQRAMENTGLFPNMVIQMIAVGEESGSLDEMSAQGRDFYEAEVDNAVDAMSSLLEPLIMAILGVLVGGLVIAMYLPIFKLGAVV